MLILYLSSWRISWQVSYEDTEMSQHRELFGMTQAFLFYQLGGCATGLDNPQSTLRGSESHAGDPDIQTHHILVSILHVTYKAKGFISVCFPSILRAFSSFSYFTDQIPCKLNYKISKGLGANRLTLHSFLGFMCIGGNPSCFGFVSSVTQTHTIQLLRRILLSLIIWNF